MFDLKSLNAIFLEEGLEQIDLLEKGLLQLEASPDDPETVHGLYRAIHTLKGGCHVVGLGELGEFCHQSEEILGLLRLRRIAVSNDLISALLAAVDLMRTSLAGGADNLPFASAAATGILARLHELTGPESVAKGALPRPVGQPVTLDPTMLPELASEMRPESPGDCGRGRAATIRIDLGKIEKLVNNVGEMLIVHSMLRQSLTEIFGQERLDTRLRDNLNSLHRLGRELQENTLSLRLLPITELFQRCERTVRDLTASTGKKVDLHVHGADTELDKGITEKLVDPLMHLLRNAIDHGIEPESERVAQGKPGTGQLTLTACQRGGSIYIEVRDDGRGLCPDRIRAKALEQGLVTGDEPLREDEVYALILRPGFSTAQQITDISGRGVGMDVVRKNIEQLQGTILLASESGRGTTVTIKLPLTMAILDGLALRVGSEFYLLPIGYVLESRVVGHQDVQFVNDRHAMVHLRDEWLPLVSLHRQLGGCAVALGERNVLVVIECGGTRCGLLIDEIIGQQQVVMKNLGRATPQVQGIAGGTILGDGRVALVLDAASLAAAIPRQGRIHA